MTVGICRLFPLRNGHVFLFLFVCFVLLCQVILDCILDDVTIILCVLWKMFDILY